MLETCFVSLVYSVIMHCSQFRNKSLQKDPLVKNFVALIHVCSYLCQQSFKNVRWWNEDVVALNCEACIAWCQSTCTCDELPCHLNTRPGVTFLACRLLVANLAIIQIPCLRLVLSCSKVRKRFGTQLLSKWLDGIFIDDLMHFSAEHMR